MSLASRVRELRHQLRLSQDQVAERMQAIGAPVDRSYISHIETGRAKLPSPEVMRALARALETMPDDLYAAAGVIRLEPGERAKILGDLVEDMTDEEFASVMEFIHFQRSRRRRAREHRPAEGA